MKKRLKIGIVCPYNILKDGGVQEIVLLQQAELKKRGHHVKIITPLPRDTNVVEMPDTIFVGTSTDFRSPMHTTVQVSGAADINKINDMLALEQFDVIHLHEPWIPFVSRQILQRSNSINIATFHAKVPETLMSRTVVRVVTPYLKSVLSYLDVLTAVSPSAAEYIGGMTDQEIHIIPNGIDLKRYHRSTAKSKPKKAKQILYIGRLERRKGVKYLLQAFSILCAEDPTIELLIAGNGPERERLELLAEDLHIKNVTFLGYISEERKTQLLHEADVFCSPAVYGESFGIVLLEAMASGLVTVAGNNSGYIDVLTGSGALAIVNPHDGPEFARRLKVMLYDESVRTLWLNWAQKTINQYNFETIVDAYEKLFYSSHAAHLEA